jgi:prolyl oligopeptidase
VAPGAPRWVLAYGLGARPELRLAAVPLAQLGRDARQTPWKPLAGYEDKIAWAEAYGDRAYLLSNRGAPNGQVVSVALSGRPAGETVEIAESPDVVIEEVWAARDGLYTRERADGRGRVRRLPWKGKARQAEIVPLPLAGTLSSLRTDPRLDGALVSVEDWTHPRAYHRLVAGKSTPTGLGVHVSLAQPETVAERLEARSADGTLVPLSVVRGADAPRDAPTLLEAYGGYGVSFDPYFDPVRAAWIERGAVYAVCHVRGGGEKGRAWHEGGKGKHKLKGVQDFIACAEKLIELGYTSSPRLAASGTSMGGVLVGRALVERPELFGAVHIGVGITNPARLAHAPNGANQFAEVGSPDTKDGLAALVAMDPYLNTAERAAYPAVIFTVGLHDHRVAPWMSAKFAARLQAATTSGRPIVIRVDDEAGHGIGSTRDQALSTEADVWAFLLAQMKK